MIIRSALKELARLWRTTLFMALNLALGLIGFLILDSYKNAVQDHVQTNRKKILSADLAVSARRELTDLEKQKLTELAAIFPQARSYDFFAMLSQGDKSRLVLVKAIDQNYPFYGQITLKDESALRVSPGQLWPDQTLLDMLQLDQEKPVQLGQLQLKLGTSVIKDDTMTFRSMGLAPRVYLDISQIPQSGLIQFGSTFSTSYFFSVPETKLNLLRDELIKQIPDPAIEIQTAEETGEETNRQFGALSDFLGLTALIGLFLSASGAFFLWRYFLTQRSRNIAIYRSLGLTQNQTVAISLIQTFAIGLLALIPAIGCAQLLLPLFNSLLSQLTPFPLSPILSLRSMSVALFISIGTSFLVALPFLYEISQLRPARFLLGLNPTSQNFSLKNLLLLFPALCSLWGMAVFQAKSFFVGSLFVGALTLICFVLFALGLTLLKFIATLKTKNWIFRHVFKSLVRRRQSSLVIFVLITLCTLLLNLLPQIKTSLQNEISIDENSKIPSLFLFDIQDEQIADLESSLKQRGQSFGFASPLIRARILKINDLDYERKATATGFKTREEEREERFRNRGVNLSTRENLSAAEKIVSGVPFSKNGPLGPNEIAEISIEKRYAERVGLKIGDLVTFDVQGLEIKARVINLRSVKWTSFQPNFFILFQPGVLDEAPKTWVASLPKIESELKTQLINDFAKLYPNVSVVDVQRTVNDVLSIFSQMSSAMELMVVLAFLSGLLVLASMIRVQIQQRFWELNLIKILGASQGQTTALLVLELVTITSLALLCGVGLSLVLTAILMDQLFEAQLTISLIWSFVVSVCVVVSLFVMTLFSIQKVHKTKAIELLKEN